MKKRLVSYAISLLILLSLICPAGATNIKAGDSALLGGMPFGVKFFSGNMTVSGFSEVDGENGSISPAYDAGMRENDIIIKLNGKDVKTAEEVTRTVENCNGKEVTFLCNRSGKELTFVVTPIKSVTAGTYKIGIWIKDSTAGIGTITFIDPKTGEFGGLGHGICSNDSGELLEIRRGIVSEVKISGIDKGEIGDPGELKGFFSSGRIGIVTKNTDNGVFGVLTDFNKKNKYKKTVTIASKNEVKDGKAIILCTLCDNNINEYEITINCADNEENSKSFNITVTDPRLIAETGGIVQGMSGSPIIQNGKLIGAVTHVLVNDPTRGYGIYIENMISE